MPAHCYEPPDALIVEFLRPGEEPERQLVIGLRDDRTRCCERALMRAIEMIVRRGLLSPGDRLTIWVDDGKPSH